MTDDELQALRGANDLLQEGIESGAYQVLKVQLTLTRLPYAALRHTPAPTCLVNGIEKTQEVITRGIYGSIVLGSRALSTLVATALILWAGRNHKALDVPPKLSSRGPEQAP